MKYTDDIKHGAICLVNNQVLSKGMNPHWWIELTAQTRHLGKRRDGLEHLLKCREIVGRFPLSPYLVCVSPNVNDVGLCLRPEQDLHP